jgi:hypothetical protein
MTLCRITSRAEWVFESVSSSMLDSLLVLLQTKSDLATQHYAFVVLINIVMKVFYSPAIHM